MQEIWRDSSELVCGGAGQGKRGGYLASWVTQYTEEKLTWIQTLQRGSQK